MSQPLTAKSSLLNQVLQQNSHNLLLCSLFFLIQFTTRIALSIYALYYNQVGPLALFGILFNGAISDIITSVYIYPIAYVLHLILVKPAPNVAVKLYTVVFFIFAAIMTLSAFGEIMFWDEYSTRFNFIAVDYIVYTHEIIGTIKQELIWIGFASIVSAVLLTKIFYHKIKLSITIAKNDASGALSKLITLAIYLLCLILAAQEPEQNNSNENIYAQELGKNGLHELFSAFFNNSLDYLQFYPKIDEQQALQTVRSTLTSQDVTFTSNDSIDRNIKGAAKQKNLNVALIIVESLSAEFMASFGNRHNITPYLDAMAPESIFFDNVYATGTRTVRGLEAILLSVPPTPGSSIIRRPEIANLFTAGSIFKANNYDVSFLYGGYGYFDNMSNFFTANGYNFIDRNNLDKSQITFANVWGVADEDLFNKAITYFDEQSQKGAKFFSTILTTSNHRPYDFPEGKIDLPSGSGRAAAVKYSDYAIGQFIAKAKTKPWFADTVFVITADHCASSAGKTALPVAKYHIPLLIYAPQHFAPARIANMTSQIDIIPTVLGLLNFDYQTKFFGTDAINHPANRAFIATYQLLGYLQKQQLLILSPGQQAQTYNISLDEQTKAPEVNDELAAAGISFYQLAYLNFKKRLMNNFQ